MISTEVTYKLKNILFYFASNDHHDENPFILFRKKKINFIQYFEYIENYFFFNFFDFQYLAKITMFQYNMNASSQEYCSLQCFNWPMATTTKNGTDWKESNTRVCFFFEMRMGIGNNIDLCQCEILVEAYFVFFFAL